MQLLHLKDEEVEAAAKQQFPDYVVEVDHTDWYVRSYESGSLQAKFSEVPLYLSTHYVYEDHLVQGNMTRYKVQITVIWLKKDHYDVIYDSKGLYYVAYEDEGSIHFCPYEELEDLVLPYIKVGE